MMTLCEVMFVVMLILARIDAENVSDFFDRHKYAGYVVMIITIIGWAYITSHLFIEK